MRKVDKHQRRVPHKTRRKEMDSIGRGNKHVDANRGVHDLM